MKRFIENACVKDGNEVVGFYLSDTSTSQFYIKNAYDFWQYVDMSQMKKLVSENLVRNFIYNPKLDRLEIQYTDEERKYLMKNSKIKKSYLKDMVLKDYLNYDMVIKSKYITFSERGGIPGYVANIITTPLFKGIEFFFVVFYGTRETIEELKKVHYHNLSRSDYNGLSYGINTATGLIPKTLLERMLCSSNMALDISNIGKEYLSNINSVMTFLVKEVPLSIENSKIIESASNASFSRLGL